MILHRVENHRSFFQCFGEGEFELLAAQGGVHGKIGAASPGFNAAHAAVVKRPKQKERSRIEGFTRHFLLLQARLVAKTKADHPCRQHIMLLSIRSTMVDPKIPVLRFSAWGIHE